MAQVLGAQDTFSLFDEALTPTLDIVIKDLDYQRSASESLSQGTFSFEKFKIISHETNIELHNQSHFYDAEIYRRDNLIGFQGPAASFVYRLRDKDFNYFDSIRWLKMDTVSLFMNREKIEFSGENLAMREPQTNLLAHNFDLFCSRHQDYLINDGDGFIAGCLNYGQVRPIVGPGVGIDFKFFEDSGKKMVDLQGYFKSLNFSQNRIESEVISLSSNFNDSVIINTTELRASCHKNLDVTKINSESLILPCLNNLEIEGNFLKAELLEAKDEMFITKPSIKHVDNLLNLNAEEFKYKSKDTSFSLSSSKLKCIVPEEGDPLKVNTYLKGCLNKSELFKNDDDIKFNLEVAFKDDQSQKLKLMGDVQKLSLGEDRVLLGSNEATLDINDNFEIKFKNIDWSCQKAVGLERFDIKSILEFCKKDLGVELGSFSLRDFEDTEKPFLAFTKPNLVQNKDEVLQLELPELKLVDREDLTLMENLNVACETKSGEDVFLPNDLIDACVKRGQITIDKVFTKDSTYSPSQLMDQSFSIDNVRIKKTSPSLYNIKLITKDELVYVTLSTKVLGFNSEISFSGPITWDKEKEELKVKVEQSRLPLGIKSEKIFMFFVKKMLVAEMISYEKNNTIKILL
ncbi:MAG: hypothetical protein K9K67_07510 [Bacteriovoracaceae bacterium]|nr:hypothetical protein [Bacteriovoracaceae bacterium]